MGKFMIDLPENIHNKLRHKSIDNKKDMKIIVVDAIKEWLNKN